ncbi:uncharacterized protein LOC113512858 [Galleria mellonella]|uniref:Uncharacterized protein LOC113512858 n=1 Tax=Galleria mellonella TaxID=7137 RepID=A0A6J1WFK6_GALME|nr:uncharacterized protein LOC113512858 [Galleria mellonella]
MATAKVVSRSLARLLVSRNYSLTKYVNEGTWTSGNIVKSPAKDVEIPNRLIPEHIWENMEKWPDKTAVICGITKRSFTYHQLYKNSRNLAAKLRNSLNIRDSDVICIMMPNSPDYALAILGTLQAGAEVTTVNPIYTAHEVHRQLLLSKPKLLIGIPETISVLKDALKLAKMDIPIISCRGYANNDLPDDVIAFDELANATNVDYDVLKDVSRTPSDIALLPYSSGTTGLPKGVELTNRNIVSNCVQQNSNGLRHYQDTTSTYQDATLAVLPFYHIYGLSIVLLHKLSVGVKVVTLPKFQPQSFLTTLKEQKISIFCAAPPLILFLGSNPEVKNEDLESLNVITCGAAPLPKLDIYRVLNKTKKNLAFLQLYGLTETAPLVTTLPNNSKNYVSAGVAVPNTELKIINTDEIALGPNEVGELLVRGPQVMKGYRNNPEATKQVITEDGWFRTGDIASIDEDGALTITDRVKELIKVKGYQVAPAELESILREHPDVEDAGVVGVPDSRTGEAPKAFVVVKEGSKTKAMNILNYVSERVAEFKRIKEIVFLDSLPKNPSGKLLRRILKEKYA